MVTWWIQTVGPWKLCSCQDVSGIVIEFACYNIVFFEGLVEANDLMNNLSHVFVHMYMTDDTRMVATREYETEVKCVYFK